MKKVKRKHGFEDMERILEFQLRYPEIAPERVVILELNQETLSRIFTPARIELIRAIKKYQPNTVNILCKIVKRGKESVSRDLKILENYGILDMIRSGKTKKPVYAKEAIILRT